MSEQLDLSQAEALLRKHYARLDPGALRSEAAARIRSQLEAEVAAVPGMGRRLRLEPVRPNAPRTRLGFGWSLAATVVVAAVVVAWLAIGRAANPPVAGSPSAALPPAPSTPASGSTSPSASGGMVVPSPTGPVSHQNAIAFADRNHGIVVGEYQGQGAIWTTADGGQTWASQLVSTPPLDSVAVLGTRAWTSATCTGQQNCTPAVLTSTDSGATWSVIASWPVGSLTFISAAHGFGIDASSPAPARLLETKDGGANWAAAQGSVPCETDFFPVGVSFADDRQGWVECGSGRSALGSSPKVIVATTDGGVTWTTRSRADGGGAAANSLPFVGLFRGIQMLSSGTGIAWLWNVGLIRTTDGGKTWTRLPLGLETGSLQWPGAAISPDGNLFALTVDLTAADGSATLNLGLSDGRDWKPYMEFGALPNPGTTPTPEPTSPPRPAYAGSGVAFFDASNGIAIGNDATHSYEWRTADGGKTWTVAALGKPIAVLQAASGDRVWISVSTCPDGAQPGDTGCMSVVERSDDRGVTWRTISHQTLSSISFGDATRGFAVGPLAQLGAGARPGGGGGIYTTSDGGVSWKPVADAFPCASQTPFSVSFVSTTHGWVGCSGGLGAGQGMKSVMETTDGGTTWAWRSRVDVPGGASSIGTIPSSDYLDTISMQADGAGFMTGLRGSTFRTTDGGRTWASSPPGEFDAFNTSQAAIVTGGPWFLIQSGWVAQDSTVMQARLMRSDDKGATWTQVGPVLPNP